MARSCYRDRCRGRAPERAYPGGARDLVDCARQRGHALVGALTLGVIPSLAPYVLPKILPALQRRYPELRIELRETQTKFLLEELTRGSLDVVCWRCRCRRPTWRRCRCSRPLPVRSTGGRPAGGNRPRHHSRHRSGRTDPAGRGPLPARPGAGLLRRGPARGRPRFRRHQPRHRPADGRVGYGVTLVPEVAVPVEVRDERIKLLRFAPQPAAASASPGDGHRRARRTSSRSARW